MERVSQMFSMTAGTFAQILAMPLEYYKKRMHDYAQMPNECANITKQLFQSIQSKRGTYM
jgi:hypothetical protein